MSVKLRNPSDTYGNCTVCGAYAVHHVSHRCPPEWRVRTEDYELKWATPIHAMDVEGAAEKFCEQCDCDLEYSIIRNGGITLIVERNGEEQRVEIEAESRPYYSAHVIEPTPNPNQGSEE